MYLLHVSATENRHVISTRTEFILCISYLSVRLSTHFAP